MPDRTDPLDVLPARIDAWTSAVARLDEPARRALGMAVVDAWIDGRLEQRLAPGRPLDAVRALWRELARVVEDVFGEVEVERHAAGIDEMVVRRWCWIRGWRLYEQDEDLLLMGDATVSWFLEEAADTACPKRADAIGIVAHHLRDRVHAILCANGWDAVRTRVHEHERWLPQFRALGASPVVEYVERLAAHAVPRKISREEAMTRMRDLWRCRAPEDLRVDTMGDEWRAELGDDAGWIVVERKTGAMRIDRKRR